MVPIVLASACHGSNAGPSSHPSARTAITTPSALVPAASAAASANPLPSAKPAVPPEQANPPTGPIAALSVDGSKAFVADDSGLVEISPQGPKQLISLGEMSYCNVDARGRVVWFAQDDVLYAFDLEDRIIHKVLAMDGGAAIGENVIISWGKQQLGGEDKVAYDIALQITMTNPPKIEVSVGCDGDRAYYCYGDSSASPKPTLVENLQNRKESIDAMTFTSPSYVAGIAARGATGSLWSTPPVPPRLPKAKPNVDKSKCEEDPSACGKLYAIPASTLWKVVASNDRGDFFYESHALWDPATEEFLTIENGTLSRSKAAQTMGDLGDMRVSPTGILSYQGNVFDGKTMYYVPKGGRGRSCGWSDGGFRVPGVRG